MDEILLAYEGELSLKGMNRRAFERALFKALHARLESIGKWKVRSAQSILYIEPLDDLAKQNTKEAYRRIGRVFGLAGLSRSAVCEKTLDAMIETAASYLQQNLEQAKTFRVSAKRGDKTFALNSMQIAAEVGGVLLQRFPHLSVNLHQPDFLVGVEVREKAAYVHGPKQKGAGGMPVPTSGRAALLLSGGIDSPVAAHLAAKRGLGLVAVHFASPPYTGPRARAKVERLASLLTESTGPLPLYIVPYTKTQEYLRDHLKKPEYFTVMMRRSMLRIAGIIAQKENCEALITGESLAQVASQTLQAIACTDAAQELVVLRPCLTMDKIEIMEIARQIETFETSNLPYEDCCTIFSPDHPSTRPKLPLCEEMERQLILLQSLEEEAAASSEFSLIQA